MALNVDFRLKAPENTPVWVDEAKCKSCELCVDFCPTGVLEMVPDPHNILGQMVKVSHPEYCIGCKECELECPDFCIFVAERDEYKFKKLNEVKKLKGEK
jgi:2-oxoglutarate ferredoxin oxidoreductase subunit delta